MIVVLDLQAVQLYGFQQGQGRQALALAMALLAAPGQHRLRVLLNGALPLLDELREQLVGAAAPEHICVFDPIVPAAAAHPAHAERRRANQLLREYTIAQLQADAVIAAAPFGGWDDDSVLSIGQFAPGIRHVLLVDQFPAAGNADASWAGFMASSLARLCQADLLVPLSDGAHADLVALNNEQRLLPLHTSGAAAAAGAIVAMLTDANVTATAVPVPVPAPAPRQRRKLAFITPLPPQRTGIADYAAQLLPAMLDDFDLTLIIEQEEVTLPPALAALPRHDTDWLAAHAHEFDQLLYQFGNSPFHSDMFGLLRQHPGVVVLHDFFLSSVLAYEQMTGGIPNAWSDALFHSHGFGALLASQLPNNHAEAMNNFPCSRAVLEGATRVIVHSEHAGDLARHWYGPQATHNWTVVPLPRAAPALLDRRAAREALGIEDHVFLVCSFGYIGPSKLSDTLVSAWSASKLHCDPAFAMTLVGVCPPDEFGKRLRDTIEDAGPERNVHITGWADDATYHLYLQAADMAVQLRSTSRGETSAAVLDAMNYGLATVVNANGSMAALPPDGVWMLPDQFDVSALIEALETLSEDTARRQQLGERGRDILRDQHRPDHSAQLYRDALDQAMLDGRTQRPALLGALSALPSLLADDGALRVLAEAVARAPDRLAPRQLLVDVSTIVKHDLRTGIERVVRTQLLELLQLPHTGLRVEPVYLSDAGGRWHFRYARRYAVELLGVTAPSLCDAPIDFQPGDVFYSADYAPAAVAEAARAGVYNTLRARGVSINFLVHDLLPVLRPEFFPANAERVHAAWLRCIAQHADRLLCISAAVAEEGQQWLTAAAALTDSVPVLPALVVLHHGADIDHRDSTTRCGEATADVPAALAARPSFLMVGTIEPRKGHLQALAAFELLWQAGEQINLVIVGNEGWKGLADGERRTIPEIVRRLRNHPEAGKRLFWLEGVNDMTLEAIYRCSTCLLVPSEGEGFGLPLIEAARYGLPILARDLAVFREVAEEHAMYFSGLSAPAVAAAVRGWLLLRSTASVPASAAMRWRTWRENAVQLLDIVRA